MRANYIRGWLGRGDVIAVCVAIALVLHGRARVDAGEVLQLNNASRDAATVLNSAETFVTSFQGTNDVTIKLLSGSMDGSYIDHFTAGPPSSDNNPSYITSFVGSAANGTGDGTAGGFLLLQQTAGASLQFDFSTPLTSSDRFLVADVDNNEKYSMQAFTLVGGVYTAVSLTGWTLNAYTGQMGELPNSDWPTWDPTGGGPTTGTFTSNDNTNLNEPLDVLTPDQSISRIVFTEITGNGTPGLQFFAPNTVPEPSSSVLCLIGCGGIVALAMFRRIRRRSC